MTRDYIWAALVAMVIAASLWPERELAAMAPALMALPDKFQHLMVYAALAAAAVWTARSVREKLLFLAALGFALEILQALTPSRHFDWLDAAANGLGIVSGAAAANGMVRAMRPAFCRRPQ
jgi:VanZ family protein